jgi:hypothetical protein
MASSTVPYAPTSSRMACVACSAKRSVCCSNPRRSRLSATSVGDARDPRRPPVAAGFVLVMRSACAAGAQRTIVRPIRRRTGVARRVVWVTHTRPAAVFRVAGPMSAAHFDTDIGCRKAHTLEEAR